MRFGYTSPGRLQPSPGRQPQAEGKRRAASATPLVIMALVLVALCAFDKSPGFDITRRKPAGGRGPEEPSNNGFPGTADRRPPHMVDRQQQAPAAKGAAAEHLGQQDGGDWETAGRKEAAGRKVASTVNRNAAQPAAQRPPLSSSYALADALQHSQEQPMYSTHTCINQKFDYNWHAATCKFDNMCLNAKTLQFEYYLPPEFKGLPVTYDSRGTRLESFSTHLLSISHARVNNTEAVVSWRPVVKRQHFPTGPRMKWAAAAQALIQGIPVPLTTNFGHAMYDVLVPLFNMQHLFGIYTPDAQVLIPKATQGSNQELRQSMGRLINTKRPQDSLLRLTWDHDALWLREYADRELEGKREGLICFKTVLAGTGFLSRQMAAVDALPYRQAAVWRTGLHEPLQEQPVITILNKEGRRMVENTDAIHAVLRARYPGARVDVFDFGQHPDMSIPDQIKLMSDTSVLITPCGGLATVLTFMRPGATAIAMNYWHTGYNRSLQLEDIYYSHLEYLDIQYFPVTLEEYQGTRDRPDCELVQGGSRAMDAHYDLLGALVHCNLRLGAPALQRLVDYVDAAMMRWAAQSGRYDVLDFVDQGQPQEQLAEQAQSEQQQQSAVGHSHKGIGSSRLGRAGVVAQRRL